MLPWYFSIIHYLPEKPRYFQPNKPVYKWLKKEYVEWFNRAGMSTRGNISDLKERVLNCRADGVTVDNDVGADVKKVFKMII